MFVASDKLRKANQPAPLIGTEMKSRSLNRCCCCFAAFLVCIVSADMIDAQTVPSAGMMRYPDVSKEHIVFSYADDLWVVSRDGGSASPLASPTGQELFPRFSPDGKSIAFVGNYDGGSDIYAIPTAGGVPDRLTYHPARETLCDWTPDGESVLYSTNGFSGLGRQYQLHTISLEEPLPTKLPVPYGTNGAISDDGRWLAYTPHSRDTRTWKRYRGGMASDIWLYNLKTNKSKQITDFEGTDSLPMWHGDNVYYLSDGGDEFRLNIWMYNTETGEQKQITEFKEFDCKWPSIGPGADGEGEIVFSNGSDLYLLDLQSGKSETVEVTIPGDRPTIRPRKVDVSDDIEEADISKTGKRIVVEARGDIWTLPAKNGSPRNLTATSGVAERDPVWSPDGRWIAYLADETGEYELYVTQSDGRGETKQLTNDGDCYRYLSNWSPDSKHIAFADKTGGLYVHTIESGETKKIDRDPQAAQLTANWSHDSAWITYSRQSDSKVPISSIYVYEMATGEKHQLTKDYFNDSNPTFDRKGDFVFFTSNRAFNSPKYEDLGTTFIYSGTEVLMAMPLRADVENPMMPKIDEEAWAEEDQDDEDDKSDKKKKGDQKPASGKQDKDKEDGKDDDSDDDDSDDDDSDDDDSDDDDSDDDDSDDDEKEESKDPITIEFDGAERRSYQLPAGQGNFVALAVNAENHLLYSQRPARGSGGKPSIKILDLSADKIEAKTVVDGAALFGLSADGKTMMVYREGDIYLAKPAADQKLKDKVSTSGMTAMVKPRDEWKQIFWDAWRIERDFFYDPTMHGVNWKKIGNHYAEMLEDCASRRDVGFLIGEMIAELNVGHAYYRQGGVENGPSSDVGLLGCRFEADKKKKAYQIAELYEGAEWDVDARNPLALAGVKQGQFLLEINGQKLTPEQNPYQLLEGLRGKTVSLTISDDAELDDEDKRIPFKVLANDNNLRFRAWIEAKRQYVADKSKGRVGYVYVTNTGLPGQNDLVRQYYAQMNAEAIIIDDRWNGGGQIPTRFIELMNRPVTNYWARRDGNDWTWPPDAHHGPKCMLINGMAGSGGDMFPALFKQNELGKLIGMRTWGGLVGITGGPQLIDGASVTAPSFAYYEKDGTWGIEGHGVDPDIEVIDDPAKMTKGRDPQLDAAIKQMMKELKKGAYKAPKRPKYPDRSKFGIADEDK